MAYTINLTNGSIEATIPDGTIYTDRSLVLIGRNYNGYGEFVAENFMKLLESHASAYPGPSNPLIGQVWYDTDANVLRVYDGTIFKNLTQAASQTTEPITPVEGDIWYNTTTAQLNIYDGTEYKLIGPLYSTATGTTGPIVTTIDDDSSLPHVVTLFYNQNDVIAIASKDPAFTPDVAIPGFTTVDPGIHLADNFSGHFTGTATNSELLDNLDSTQFLRSDENDVTTGTLGVNNDAGLAVGVDSDLKLTITGDNAFIANSTPNGQIVLQTTTGTGLKDVITLAIDGTDARARVSYPGTSGLDIANKDYVDTEITTLDGILSNDKVSRDGSLAMTGNLDTASNLIRNLGNATVGTDALNRNTGDGRYVTQDISSTVNGSGGVVLRIANDVGDSGTISNAAALEIYQATAGKDAFQTFHVGGDYAVQFGLDGGTNDLFVGGWSMSSQYRVHHDGNHQVGKMLHYGSSSSVSVPAGCYRAEIEIVGGGGGGGSGGDGGNWAGGNGGTGGNSAFHTPSTGWITVYGGVGGRGNIGAFSGSSTNHQYNRRPRGYGWGVEESGNMGGPAAGNGPPTRGGDGGSSPLGFGGSGGAAFGSGYGRNGQWGGGGGGGVGQDSLPGEGGGSGKCLSYQASVSPGQTVTFTVGGGGARGTNPYTSDRYGGYGGGGYIRIKFFRS